MPFDIDTILNAATSAGLAGEAAVTAVRSASRQRRLDPIETLSIHARIPSAAIYQALARTQGLPYVDVIHSVPPSHLLERIPASLMRRKRVLPIAERSEGVLVATSEPEEPQTREALVRALGCPVLLGLTNPRDLSRAIERSLRHTTEDEATTDPVAFLDEIMREAYVRRASDIHLDPQENGQRVRFRIDGILHVYRQDIPPRLGGGTLSRVKILAGMDITETRESQDGGFTYRLPELPDAPLDIRVATAPTRYGERATLRILGTDTESLRVETLGFSNETQREFRALIQRDYGLILITGPTGSGKTTTLYAALREINEPSLNILTVEDPIEYAIPGVSQVQIDPIGKVSFAQALRSLLRHDPDVLMVGEIRDPETADLAVRSAMTGHVVFSTLHTNSACGAITRLIDMGCEPYLVASTLTAVFAQRLVRKLCSACKRPDSNDPSTYIPVGCLRCTGTGYYGRTAIFEHLRVNPEVARAIARRSPEEELARLAGESGFRSLRTDALDKIATGMTSSQEVTGILE